MLQHSIDCDLDEVLDEIEAEYVKANILLPKHAQTKSRVLNFFLEDEKKKLYCQQRHSLGALTVFNESDLRDYENEFGLNVDSGDKNHSMQKLTLNQTIKREPRLKLTKTTRGNRRRGMTVKIVYELDKLQKHDLDEMKDEREVSEYWFEKEDNSIDRIKAAQSEI